MTDAKKERALENTVASLTKRFGEGVIMRLGDAAHMQVDSIPTGCLPLDIAMGIGGLPRGRVIEIYGPESSGKTTMCQHVIAEAQKRGGICGFIDMEHALDPAYAAKIGVNIDELYISQPDTGEQALEIAEALIRSGTMDVVVLIPSPPLSPAQKSKGRWVTATWVCKHVSCRKHYAKCRASLNRLTRWSFSPINSDKKLGLCLEILKPQRAVMP